jgi:hypothetical protein
MVGGKFSGSNVSASEGFKVLAEIKTAPPRGEWSEIKFDNSTPYRWVRYEAPPGNLGDLLARMKQLVAWDQKPATVTTTTLKRIKDYVLAWKESAEDHPVLVSAEELRTRLEATDPQWHFTDDEISRQRALQQCLFAFGELQRQRLLARGGRHFLPGLLKDAHHLFGFGLVDQIGELMLQGHQAERVFEHLALGILREILFEIQLLDARKDVLAVADFAENFGGFLRVELFQVRAPFQVSGARHGVGFSRDHPPADVLAARGQQQGFGCLRAKTQHPIANPF